MSRLMRAVACCVVAVPAFGCAGEDKPLRRDMTLLALAYHNLAGGGAGPKDVEDFQRAFQPGAACLERVRTGQVVVRWGLRIPSDFPDGMSNTVLLYEKDVPTRGGPVVMGDGSYRTMTADEFRSSPAPRSASGSGK
jgi:hypothetical protein